MLYVVARLILKPTFFSFLLVHNEWLIIIYNIRQKGDFNFEIISFSFLGGDVPHSPSDSVYISQVIRFAGVHCIF